MDNISVEMLKAGGETTVTVLKSIIDRIWENGEWPQVTRLGNLRIYHIVNSYMPRTTYNVMQTIVFTIEILKVQPEQLV